jgi:SM-20-related protein
MAFKKAGIGDRNHQQLNESIRGDHIRWLEENSTPEPLLLYLQRLHDLRQFLNRSLFLSLQDIEVHMTIYPSGTHYARHRDQFKRDDRRKLSVICYLNEDWLESQGGQLRMYLDTHQVDVLPVAGRLVCFRSDQIEHEVLPASRDRRSLTGWMLDRTFA